MNEKRANVYLSQPQWRKSEATQTRRPMINPTEFRDYGAPVYLLDDGQFTNGEIAWAEINRRLDETDYDPSGDFLIVSGDVTLACLAYHAMMIRGGARLLRWDRETRSYDVIEIIPEVEEPQT